MSLSKYTGKFLSILFRIVIVLFGIFIVATKDNIFSNYWYYLAIIPYISIYLFTLFGEGYISKIRLLNDFILITFFSFQKEIDIYILIFITLPIINSPNHSGDKKSILLYLFYLISLFVINDFIWEWSFLIITFFLMLINGISRLRQQYFLNVSKLNNQIEIFLEKDLEINKSYKIYEGLIKCINSTDIMIGFNPKIAQVVCFSIENNSLFLVNSSKFIWNHWIDENQVIKYVRSRKSDNIFSNISIVLNGVEKENNFFIYNKIKNKDFVFIFISESPFNNKVGIIYLKKILNSVTNRISRVIVTENEIKTFRKLMLNDFRNKYFQIQNAEKAMHFIRNRFNTLDNFIEMSKDNLAEEMDLESKELYKTELERLERNYNLLMDRVKSILNKSNKPFSATNLENKSINYTFNLIREVWSDYFNKFNSEVKIDFKLSEKQTIKLNTDGFYILISDWISNIKKHSSGNECVIFDEDNENFKIIFENSFFPEHKQEIEALKNDFNSTERDKILQRTSHGVLIMKSILDEMNVKGIIDIIDNKLKLELTLKKM